MQVARGLTLPEGPSQTETLDALIADPDPRVRVHAVRSLSYPGAPVDPYLTRALGDPNPQVVAAAVIGLGRTGSRQAAWPLLEIINRSSMAWLRAEAILAMGKVDPNNAAGLARRLLENHHDPETRAAVARHLESQTQIS